MLIIGVLLGFMAALCQASSYICSRVFLHKYPGENIKLLLISHLIMGIVSLLALPFVLAESFHLLPDIILPLLGCAGFYMIAQASLFMVLKHTEASRVSPLLGLKIFFVAIFSILFLDASFSFIQWIAIGSGLLAAGFLNWSGAPPPFKSLIFILITCVGYSLSDINIKLLIEHFNSISLMHAAFFAVIMTYFLCGFVSFIFLVMMKKSSNQMIKDTIPFSIFWFVSMFFLFACFALISVMLGNIIQSTRGVISILLAVFIAKIGYEHIEQKVSRAVFIRRIVAAIFMFISIIVFIFDPKF
jgi:uncharacterized membrane protein